MSSGTQVVVVEPKWCELCGTTFYRMHAELRKLSNGNVIDPNRYCPTCEHRLAESARNSISEVRQSYELVASRRREQDEEAGRDRMERECLRKEMFLSPSLALRVAARSRKRHQGSNPNQFYRCRTVIDPVKHPDRARPHWHLGGDSSRKF
jgi:hypothetical protein